MAVMHKYLKEEVLKDRKGNTILTPVPDGPPVEGAQKFMLKELTSGLFAFLVLDAYVPLQEFFLRPAEMRHYNSALNLLEGEKPQNGYWELDDREFTILKQCLEHIAPRHPLLAKHQVAMDNVMQMVLDRLPP